MLNLSRWSRFVRRRRYADCAACALFALPDIFWQVEARHTVLDMSAGWGGLAIHLARTRGCNVIGLVGTNSEKEYADLQAKEAAVAGLVRFEVSDIGTLARYGHT